MRQVDLLITSNSKIRLLPYMWESVKKKIYFRGNVRVLVHEDFVSPKESKLVLSWLNDRKKIGEFNEIYHHNPSIGLDKSLNYMIKNHVRSDFLLYIQSDYEFERPIDVDQIVWCMEENSHINSILFPTEKNIPVLNKNPQTQITYSGLDLCIYHDWHFLPGIHRTDFIKKQIDNDSNSLGTPQLRANNKYCIENIGAYWLGITNDYRYLRKIDSNDVSDRAPWLSLLEKRV